MATNDEWVDAQLKILDVPPGWVPDLARARDLLTSAPTIPVRSRRLPMAVAALAVAGALLSSVPATRVFAERCVAVCVGQTARVGRFIQEGMFGSAPS